MAPVHLEQTATAVPYSAPIAEVPQSFLVRTQKFIEENQRLILLGCAVAASAGAGYYFYSRSDKPGPSTSGEGKKSKKNKRRNRDRLRGEGTSGPLLEEITPPASPAPSTSQEKTAPAAPPAVEQQAPGTSHLNDVPDAAGLAAMSETDRNALGVKLKDRGNTLYSRRDFQRAVECYTKAIEVSVKKDAVFFSNRAACYTNFSPPEYEKVVADCDEALKLDRAYAKALKRRASALEHLGRYEEAVRDFTATTIIERFADQQAADSVERCLKNLAQNRAAEMLATREPKLPSPTFISSYLAAFRPHDKPTLPENPSQGDQTLLLAFDAMAAADYAHAVTFANEAIDQGVSWKQGQAEAYNLRGTFKFLIGDSVGAKEDFEKSLDLAPNFVQSWVKIASVHMELGAEADAFGDFEAAIRHNPNDPDIYYHRGQINFVKEEYDKAIADYTKSTELDGSFIFTHVQLAVAQYKLKNVAASMAAFRRILRDFPDRGEPSNYYGEILLDQEKYSESVERFDRSLELDKNKRPRNVLPLVNKAIAYLTWTQDSAKAETLCREALDIDPDCDVAVATLAQLSLQQGKIDEAIVFFEKAAKLARTEQELINALVYEHASRAQRSFMQNYPEYAERLSQMARAM